MDELAKRQEKEAGEEEYRIGQVRRADERIRLEDLRLKLEERKLMAEGPQRAVQRMDKFIDRAGKSAGLLRSASLNDQESGQAAILNAGYEERIPEGIVHAYIKQGADVVGDLPSLKQYLPPDALSTAANTDLLKKGPVEVRKHLWTLAGPELYAQTFGNGGAIGRVVADLDEQEQFRGKPKPWNLVITLAAGGDKARLQYLTGQDPAGQTKEGWARRRAEFVRHGVQDPEEAKRQAEAAAKRAPKTAADYVGKEVNKQLALDGIDPQTATTEQRQAAADKLLLRQDLSQDTRERLRRIGTSAEEATPAQITAAGKEREAERLERARAQAQATAEAREAVPVKMSAAERKEITGDEATINLLGDIQRTYKQGFVGPVSGEWVGWLGQKTGTISPQQAEFIAFGKKLENAMLRLAEGASASDEDVKRIKAELPTPDLHPVEFEARLRTTYRTARQLAETRRKIMRATGVDVSGLDELPRIKALEAQPEERGSIPQAPKVQRWGRDKDGRPIQLQ
jgi:hypothetical protein